MARKKKSELEAQKNVAVEETATQQDKPVEEAKEVKTTSVKKGSKNTKGVKKAPKAEKSDAEKKAQQDFEATVLTFTDAGLCPCCDRCEEEEDESDWIQLDGSYLGSNRAITLYKRVGVNRYVINFTIGEDFDLLRPRNVEDYPSYVSGGIFRSRLDAQNFFEFCVKDYEVTGLKSVDVVY